MNSLEHSTVQVIILKATLNNFNAKHCIKVLNNSACQTARMRTEFMGTNKTRLTQRRLLFKGGFDIIDVTLGGTNVQGHCLRGGYGEAKHDV